MNSSFRVLSNDGRHAAPQYDREDVRLVLASAARDPVIVQQLRGALARSSPGIATFRLNDREMLAQVENLVLRGEVVLAPVGVKPASKGLKTYNGRKFDDPVKFDGGTWAAVWPVATTPTPGELGEVSSGLDSDAANTEVTTVFDGPNVAQEMLTKLNEMEDKKKQTAEAQKKSEKQLVEAKKERDEAKKRVDGATTPGEKSQATADLENAEEKIKGHTQMIEIHKNHLKELQAKGPRAVKTLRLHEQTHVDIYAKVAEHVNKLLKSEADPGKREKIIDEGIRIGDSVTVEMDSLLNPGDFGSEKDEKDLNAWISESSAQNYHLSIANEFAALP